MLVRCKDGTAIEVAGNAFKLKGAIADAATSAAPLSEAFLQLSLSSRFFFIRRGDVRWLT